MSATITKSIAAVLLLAGVAVAADAPPPAPAPEAVPETLPAVQPPSPYSAPVGDEHVTFDSMESIPFENQPEPPDEPPVLDNAVTLPALDNAAATARPVLDNGAIAPLPADNAVKAPTPPGSLIGVVK